MERWANCPGSVRESDGLPNVSSPAAEEGTLAHSIAAELLEHPERRLAMELLYEKEMLDYIQMYLDVIEITDAPGRTVLGIEEAFDMSTTLHPRLFGTTDTWAYYLDQRLLRVYDLKYGKKAVKVSENLQLLYYATGALLRLPFPVDEIELVVVQPRVPRYGEVVFRWRFPFLEKMLDFIAYLVERAQATEALNAPLVTGSWCFFCPANTAGTCPAKHAERNEKARGQFSAVMPEDVANLKTVVTEGEIHGQENSQHPGIPGELPEVVPLGA